jgi:polysaccharide export outer membrane protein
MKLLHVIVLLALCSAGAAGAQPEAQTAPPSNPDSAVADPASAPAAVAPPQQDALPAPIEAPASNTQTAVPQQAAPPQQHIPTAPTETAAGTETSAPAATTDAAQTNPDYRLGTGDKLRIIVFGEDDLGGEYVVDAGGYIRLPLVGQLKASGLSPGEFERQMITVLQEGYLKDPRVSIEVLNFRPFYILGEVNKPGEYPYSSEMSVLNAVAKAGGYTYRANTSNVLIRRAGATREEAAPADHTTKIAPGDIIRIRERFF